MNSDPKKQKRLGPAPIASFEKSFEDNTATSLPINLITTTTIATAAAAASITTTTTTATATEAVATTTEIKNNSTNNAENIKQKMNGGGQSKGVSSASSAVIKKQEQPHQQQQQQQQPQLQQVQQSSTSVSLTPSKRLYDIGATLGLNTPSTPRIDISRASSSSHHEDSRDSSPENVFEQVGTGTLQEAIALGFREEGALELRSSTEELYFMDPEQKKEEKEKMQQARKSPVIFKFDEHQTFLQQHQRKDSASSEVAALLCISGRTSRISSVGSQGSAVSRLSAISGVSRSPSPHRMLLETSFCGPKPLENVVDGSIVSTVEPPTADVLEQVLLSRKHDPTQAVFAEGIKIENSPKKQIANGETKSKVITEKVTESRDSKVAAIPSTSSRGAHRKGISSAAKRDGKLVVGVTPSGTEYIRINLKPDHMYEDKGVAPHERIVDSKNKGGCVQKKPATLSLGKDIAQTEQRLTPNSSPKPARHAALTREVGGSRSPSPATVVAMSRKSSFCSLFKTKDSPDSPRDRSRSRSKSRDRSTPVSQSGTPNKQKSVLAIFKPKRSGSKSKCSSPIDQDTMSQLDGISQVEFKFKSETPEPRSRPQSRLRYYDAPLDGKSIHIPLHTPPEEKEAKKFLPTENTKESEPPPAPVQSKDLPISESKNELQQEQIVVAAEQVPVLPLKSPRPPQLEKVQRIENLDAIHTLPRNISERERTWSLEVQRHSSQDSQENVLMENSISANTNRILHSTITEVSEVVTIKENGVPHKQTSQEKQQPQQQQQQQTQVFGQVSGADQRAGDHLTREKRRLLFATRLGSGSQEQIFSTQFSLSKTESLSSQLSEQTSIPESPALEGRETLHRSDTVIRRPEECVILKSHKKKDIAKEHPLEDTKFTETGVDQQKQKQLLVQKSKSTSEEEDKRSTVVTMRKKESLEEGKRKTKSSLEEDDNSNRHSRYIESFDIKKEFQDVGRKQTSKNSSDSSIKERDSHTSSREDQDVISTCELTKKGANEADLPLPQRPIERQSLLSTDEPAESSESERDTEMDPNRIRRHLPHHIGVIEDHESTGLVSQDSFEDELPYVPTTLPEERALGVSLIPMKDRANIEIKTCAVDRPRSTTPMNPACLEEYCGIAVPPEDNENIPVRGTKLRISLPRKDSIKDKTQKTKSPRRISNVSGKSWFEFAEQGIRGSSSTTPTQHLPGIERRDSKTEEEPPPPLPPRKPAVGGSTQWINFENIPEKRKPPKRITALPRDSPQDPARNLPSVQYNYVKPEECQCECHGIERESVSGAHKTITSVDLLQQGGGEDLEPLLEPESQEGIDPSDSSMEYSYSGEILTAIEQKTYDVDLMHDKSRRSSTQSQEPDSPDRISSTHRNTST